MWKSGAGERDRSGKPEENSWDSLQDVDPHREEYLLGRTAHSARNEETIHDRTGQLVSENLQGNAHFENFIMESEITEFVNKVRDQVRIRQKRMSSIAENCAEHSIIWRMFMATTLNAAICEEFEDHQDRTEQPVILVGQSIVLGEVKAEVLVHDEDPRNDQIIWQQYIQQVESISPENKLSKFCKEAGFMRVVEVGQYFVTRDTGDFRQFQTVACREYTLPRGDKASQPKGWIQGNMRIGLVLEVSTSFQHFKYGIEIRIESVNQDDSHSWVRIS